jgi:hypothetical protein
MAITFVKFLKFEPKNVKEQDFDIDKNWFAKSINFDLENQTDTANIYRYTLQLLHKKTQNITPKMQISIILYRTNHYDRTLMEVQIKEAISNYGYSYSYHQNERQRNIFIFLKKIVKNIEFIKNMYQMRRATQRETFKTFGKIFINER